MRYGSFRAANRTFAGVIIGETVYDISQCWFKAKKRPFKWEDVGAFIASGHADEKFDYPQYAHEPRCALKLRALNPCAPITRPPKIIAVGLNYKSHAAEQKKPAPDTPMIFAKSPTAVVGPEDVIKLPAVAPDQVDPEVELGVVIGSGGAVFGYTIINDVSARDIQAKDKQFFRAKSFPTFAPMGPIIVTADELDASNLILELKVNGEIRQKGSTSDMAFDVPALVKFISDAMPLEPGDVIATGTPSGVGLYRNPPVFLKPGDVVEASIQGIGTICNSVE